MLVFTAMIILKVVSGTLPNLLQNVIFLKRSSLRVNYEKKKKVY